MNIRLGLISISVLLLACNVKTKNNGSDQTNMPLIGTWQLISGTLIEQGDTVVTDYMETCPLSRLLMTHILLF